jgi:membrane protein implicated in regulation of membrane protease activity
MDTMGGVVSFLNHWWNVPFLVMLLLVALYVLLQLVGFLGHDADHDHDHDHDHDGGIGHGFLGFLGAGQVPFLIIWTSFFFVAGFTGLVFNRLVYLSIGAPGWLFPASLATSLVVGSVVTKGIARIARRYVDISAKPGTTKRSLAGRFGTVASATLDGDFGEVRVHDGTNEILVHGRTQDGEAALPRGSRVVLVDFDEARELYWVTGSPDDDQATRGT